MGIGILGKEGRQAVNNSDYAIAQFRFLVCLCSAHPCTRSWLRLLLSVDRSDRADSMTRQLRLVALILLLTS